MEYVHLVGGEEVQRAANTMREAAELMQRAAATISESNTQHQRCMTEFIERLAGAFEDHITMLRAS